jgi:hypothetical protein
MNWNIGADGIIKIIVIYLNTFCIPDFTALNDEGLMNNELEKDMERTNFDII